MSEMGKRVLRAMDPTSGKKLAVFLPLRFQDSFGMGRRSRSTPAISNGLVVPPGRKAWCMRVHERWFLAMEGELGRKIFITEGFSGVVLRSHYRGEGYFDAGGKIREWLLWS